MTNPVAGAASVLPILDLSALRDPGAGQLARTELVDALRYACHGPGFFYVSGHGVDPSMCAGMLDVAGRFFACGLPEKLAIENVHSPHFRGYTRVGHERTNGRPDVREQLDFGPERPARSRVGGDPPYVGLEGPNQWPAAVPELRDVVLGYMDALQEVALLLVRALAVSLGQPADRFDGTFARDPSPHLKVIRYPVPDGEHAGSTQGVGAHKDYGYLALLLQDDTGGLQVAAGDGFVDVPPVAGTFVCNVGEMFEVATHGYYRATVHRVVAPPPGRARISVPFFFAPRLDARLDPVELPEQLRADLPEPHEPDPNNPIFADYGVNALKGWLRSHPEVARRYWADIAVSEL